MTNKEILEQLDKKVDRLTEDMAVTKNIIKGEDGGPGLKLDVENLKKFMWTIIGGLIVINSALAVVVLRLLLK